MPYVSDKQRKYFHAAEARGEMKPSVVREFDAASKGKALPKEAPDGDPRHGVLMEIHKLAQAHLGQHLASKKHVPEPEPGPPEADEADMQRLMELEESKRKPSKPAKV